MNNLKAFPILVGVLHDSGTLLHFHPYSAPIPSRGDYSSELEYCRAYVEQAGSTPANVGLKGYRVGGRWYYLKNKSLGSIRFSSVQAADGFLVEAGIDKTEREVRVGTYDDVVHGGAYGPRKPIPAT